MRLCDVCEGPTASCPSCKRYHCDDPTCSGTPIACARADTGEPATPAAWIGASADPGDGRW